MKMKCQKSKQHHPNNCRIGKVKFKSGGELQLLKTSEKPYCFGAIDNLRERVNEDTLAVGFFIVHRDRTTTTGWSYDYGTTNNDLIGAAEYLKTDIIDREVNGNDRQS